MDSAEEVSRPGCPNCGATVEAEHRFCGSCGREINVVWTNAPGGDQDVFTVLQPTLIYYGVTLLLLATFKLTDFFGNGFDGMMVITILDTLIVVAFWTSFHRQMKPLFSLEKVKLKLVLITLVCAAAGAVVVSVLADLINISISDDVFYNTYLFEDTNYPFLFSVLFIAVQPAIFEEVTFRGFIYSNVSRVATPFNTIYITGFIFGIIHLAIISMLWLVPIGVIFAWLRWKHDTLWYGIIGHFTYNFCITVMEYNGWVLN